MFRRFMIVCPVLLLGVGLAESADAAIFRCQLGSEWDDNSRIPVTAVHDESTGEAFISAAGVTQEAVYTAQGFDRRWDFGVNDEGKFDYAFVIYPDGSAMYYDFTSLDTGGPADNALQPYVCKQTK